MNYTFDSKKVYNLRQTLTTAEYDRAMAALLELCKVAKGTENVEFNFPEQAWPSYLTRTHIVKISEQAEGFDARFMSTALSMLYEWYTSLDSQ
jgi:hypothetical protein